MRRTGANADPFAHSLRHGERERQSCSLSLIIFLLSLFLCFFFFSPFLSLPLTIKHWFNRIIFDWPNFNPLLSIITSAMAHPLATHCSTSLIRIHIPRVISFSLFSVCIACYVMRCSLASHIQNNMSTNHYFLSLSLPLSPSLSFIQQRDNRHWLSEMTTMNVERRQKIYMNARIYLIENIKVLARRGQLNQDNHQQSNAMIAADIPCANVGGQILVQMVVQMASAFKTPSQLWPGSHEHIISQLTNT